MESFSSNIVIGATGTVKGDIELNNLRTENGVDIDGYIKKTNSSKFIQATSYSRKR